MNDAQKTIHFEPSGRGKARCAPDPNYPNGIAIPCPSGVLDSCLVELPYPAPECGLWLVSCGACDCTMAVTAAGRPDDPISLHMPCKKEARNAQDLGANVAQKTAVN